MSYKYDRENGFRNADQIGADTEEYNEILYKLVQAIKKTKDTRAAMNMVSAFVRGMNDYQEYIQEEQVNVKENEQYDINRKNITLTTNTNVVQENEQDAEEYEQKRENIELTGDKVFEHKREEITLSEQEDNAREA